MKKGTAYYSQKKREERFPKKHNLYQIRGGKGRARGETKAFGKSFKVFRSRGGEGKRNV